MAKKKMTEKQLANLRPVTIETAAARGHIGGIASGKSKRPGGRAYERRALAEELRKLLSEETAPGSGVSKQTAILMKALQRLFERPSMQEVKILAEVLNELKVTLDASDIVLNINTDKDGGEALNRMLKGE